MAAGKGTRMKSRLPKVLHRLAGRALLQHVTDTAAGLNARSCVVITGHGATEVEAKIDRLAMGYSGFDMKCVRQEPQLGTGHAVQQAVPLLPDDGVVVVLSGDVPLIAADTLRALIAACAGQRLALLTIDFADPTGYGRIVRGHAGWAGDDIAGAGDAAPVLAIVEQKDATEAERQIHEVYSGIMAVPARLLKGWLARLDNRNAQGEYYLTDVVKFAVADGVPVVAHRIDDALQVAGHQQPLAAGGTGARAPEAPGARAHGAGRAPGRPGAPGCARHAAVRPGCGHRRQLPLRGRRGAGRRRARGRRTASLPTPRSRPAR
jgi:bifunctional UDP-N-acetylglucosamine pyrophosphorylase/glucosamine-1-phosphate N-acetyltransferase